MSFTRTIEDFACEQCGARVTGDGYTNHCPRCLWSKHVDLSPGDRASPCGGAMEPVSVRVPSGAARKIVHRCLLCGFIRAQSAAKEDNSKLLIELSARPW
jgi:rubrerythrin